MNRFVLSQRRAALLGGCLALLVAAVPVSVFTGALAVADDMHNHAMDAHHTSTFSGKKVNGGYVVHSTQDGKSILTLSDDFKIPDTPAPHWQVVDSQGNTYLLQRLKIKDDKVNKSITVPAYVHDVAKVQIWCAWAEVLLGEASFDKPIMSTASAK